MNTVRRVKKTGGWLVVATVALSSCSLISGDDDGSQAALPEVDIGQVGLVPGARIGDGRAVKAVRSGDVVAVATSVGLYVASDGATFEPLSSQLRLSANDLAISPDGAYIAASTGDGQLEVWSLLNGSVSARGEQARSVSFRADGTLVVVRPDSIEIVQPADGTVAGVFEQPNDEILAVANDRGGPLVFALAAGPTFELVKWTPGEGDERSALDLPAGAEVLAVEADASSGRTAVAYSDPVEFISTVLVQESGSSSPWSFDVGDAGRAGSWRLRADGAVVFASADGVSVIDPENGLVPGPATSLGVEFLGSTEAGEDYAVLEDGSIATLPEAGEPRSIPDPGGQLNSVEPDRAGAVMVERSGRILVTDVAGGTSRTIERFVGGSVNDVSVSADGLVAFATTFGTARVVADPRENNPGQLVLDHPEGNVDAVAFSPAGTELFTGVAQRRSGSSFDDSLSVWDLESAERTLRLFGEAEDVAGCSFFDNVVRISPDGAFLVATSHDFTAAMVDPTSGRVIHTFAPHGNTILDVAISADSTKLVTSADDSTLRVWDTATFELIAEHEVSSGGFWSLSFLPDGQTLVVGDLLGRLMTFDSITGETGTEFESSKLRATRTAVSPDGSLIASGGDDNLVRLWATGTGRLVAEFQAHFGSVHAAEFFDDGNRLATGSADGTVMVWQIRPD